MATNIVSIIGRIAKEPQVNYANSKKTDKQVAISRFALAYDEGNDNVSFFDCKMFGKPAESVSKYLAKGKQVSITGRLNQEKWKDANGENHSRVVVLVDDLMLLGAKKGEEASATAPASAPAEEVPADTENDIAF